MLLDTDPRFVDAGNGNYHLQPGSPLIDAGDPDSPPYADGTRADIGAFAYVSTDAVPTPEKVLPAAFDLSSPYPNPFNSATIVVFTLPGERSVRINFLGREVAVAFEGRLGAGSHRMTLEMTEHASGIYFLQLDAGADHAVCKLVYVR